MSSTTNIQNLLVNVFRPVYTYELPAGGSISNYSVRLNLSNIYTYSGNVLAVSRIDVGDSNFNVYVGSNSGNIFGAASTSFCNVAVGVLAGGTNTGASNSVYVGYNAGNAGTGVNVIAIGANSIGNGTSNIYLGSGTGGAGSSNIYIGHGIAPDVLSNTLRIGTTSAPLISGDMASGWVGVNTIAPLNLSVPDINFDVSGGAYFGGKVGIQKVSTASLAVNGVTESTGGFYSTQGTTAQIPNGGSVVVGVLKKGLIMSSALSTTDENAFAAYLDIVVNPDTPTVYSINQSSIGISFQYTGSNISISNTSGSAHFCKWSITYFPSP